MSRFVTSVAGVAVGASLLAGALVWAACGGSGGAASPPSPTPTPTPQPTGGVCGILGGTASGAQGIINGTACSSANSPVVLVNLRDATGGALGACSGTIIATRAVLTAAHCLSGETAAVKIYLGSGEQILADSFYPSPDYHPNDPSSLDVGIVITAQDLGRPGVPLLLSRDARVGEQAVIAGWGEDAMGAGTVLRAATTSIATVGPYYLETTNGTGLSSVCSGDSGGPILLSEGGVWAVAGVVSATSGSNCLSGASLYANIRNAANMSFILGLVPLAGRR